MRHGFLAGACLGIALAAQPIARPIFKAASIEIAGGSGEREIDMNEGTLTLRSVTLRDMISLAFSIDAANITGPAWISTQRYDVTADSGTRSSTAQMRAMLQALLADRLKLEAHAAAKERAVDAMVATGERPKLTRGQADGRTGIALEGVNLTFRNYSMDALAGYLSTRTPGRPLMNQTGLDGVFDFSIKLVEHAPEDPAEARTAAAAAMSSEALRRIVAAQIGLKLEERRESIKTLVVDRAERVPAAN